MQNKSNIIKNIILFIIMVTIIFLLYKVYEKYNFNDFQKAEYILDNSKFERDSSVKYNENYSYKIENINYNDAMFYKEIDVKPKTSYRVTCKIKSQDINLKNINADAGAHICIADTTEKSDNIVGTTEWTNVEFYFNSKDRENVKIGFRLGGYESDAIGTAWFSDFKIESGISDTSNNWNFLCVLFDNVDVVLNGNKIQLQLTQTDKEDMNLCIRRFKNSMEELSKNKIKVNYDIVETSKPIKNISYDEENGYYVSGYDVKDVIDPYIKQGKYDHIFIAFRTGDINKKEKIQVNDWIGLGSMEYRGLGFSNIRLPEDDNDYVYKYNSRINTFPEEVYIHEFLHTLERNAKENGYTRPELHNSMVYGYENKALIGLKDWYKDYMNKEIKTASGNVGLPNEIYNIKPVKESNFEYSYELNYFKEPENILEAISDISKKIINLFAKSNQIENTV